MATTLFDALRGNCYPGRGIVAGLTSQGRRFFAYFLTGRSENSQNRIMRAEGNKVFTAPFDAAKVKDPSLIIYQCVGELDGCVLVTNGDQTQTILETGKFRDALGKRTYEPDAPSYTPRISALLGKQGFEMAILRRNPKDGGCDRDFFTYGYVPGEARYITTYVTDGNPLPSWAGEPRQVAVPGAIDEIGRQLWASLDSRTRISLVVRQIDGFRQHMYNKHLGD